MNCDNFELPPILEPEANIIHETFIKDRSQQLNSAEALERSAGDQMGDDQSSRNSDQKRELYSIHTLIYLVVISFLVYTVIYFWYKFEKLKALVHNQTYSYGYASTNSVYSAGTTSNSSGSQNGDSPKYAFPDKGPKKFIERYLIHPQTESRLVKSHQPSKPNLYSELGSSVYISSSEKQSESVNSPGRVVIGSSLRAPAQQEHEYQVPRPVASPKPTNQDILSRPLPRPDFPPKYEDPIYEEIYSRSHSHK